MSHLPDGVTVTADASWLQLGVELDGGQTVTRQLVDQVIAEELQALRATIGDQAYAAARMDDATAIYRQLALSEDFADFLTLPAYERLS